MRSILAVLITVLGCGGGLVVEPPDGGEKGKGGTSKETPAIDAGPAPSTMGCAAGVHLFCEDFDRVADPKGSFDSTLLIGSATLERTFALATSTPAALKARADTGGEAAVVKTFAVPAGNVTARVEAYAFVSVMPEMSNVPIITLHADPDDISIALSGGLYGWAGLVVRPVASSSTTFGTTGTLVGGTWVRLRLELAITGSVIESFTTTLNDEKPTTWSLAIPRPSALMLTVGSRPALKGGTTQVTFDDVTFDFVP
jgi:hypothetical protein